MRTSFPPFIIAFLLASLALQASDSRAEEAYPLDTVDRAVKTRRGKVVCPKLAFVSYRGTGVRYHRAVRVHPAFAKRLVEFEKVGNTVALEVYGRVPRTMKHMGAYNCRRIGGYPEFLSEHALGNGIDVAGFDFGPLPRAERRKSPLPRALQRSFKVRLGKHWQRTGRWAVHARFLDTLARRLVAREDIFRVLLGPAFPGHKTHFHFDVAPWRLVDIW